MHRIERKKAALGKLQVQSRSKEDLKTVRHLSLFVHSWSFSNLL